MAKPLVFLKTRGAFASYREKIDQNVLHNYDNGHAMTSSTAQNLRVNDPLKPILLKLIKDLESSLSFLLRNYWPVSPASRFPLNLCRTHAGLKQRVDPKAADFLHTFYLGYCSFCF